MAVSPNDASIPSAELHTLSGLERLVVVSLGNIKRPRATLRYIYQMGLRIVCSSWLSRTVPSLQGAECPKERSSCIRAQGRRNERLSLEIGSPKIEIRRDGIS